MTPKQLLRRVEKWQTVLEPLGLGHYRIDVKVEAETPAGPTAIAACEISEHYDNVTIHFTWDLIDEGDEQKIDETIIHELLHVVWRDMDVLVRSIEPWMPEATYEDFGSRVYHEREGIVERIARAIYASHKE